ncbi:MAG: ABC transporter substrate-binding protein [Ignavibacteriae bacterium]|nr:ABC transporter substrate-binding protein [Ignavibacteria bacterium]MBI3364250.1 ABC transporter substrate-binding protein [Ignavibacteriota bacterium]
MKKVKIRIEESFIILIAICFGLLIGCTNSQRNTAQQLTVGIQNSPSNSLVIVASKKGFFDTTKVKVIVKEFSAGKLALQALLGQAGDLDVAVSAETPIALSSLGGNKLKVITQIVNAKNECRVVARQDGDLKTPESYFNKPRKLTTSQGGSPEWFTYNFIKQFKLDKSKIEVIAMLPENMPVALSNGAVDAISIFDPYARLGENELREKGVTFYNTGITSYYVMSVKENTLSQKSEALKELIKGLLGAQEFIKNNPDEAKQIVAVQTKLDIAILNQTWSNYTFSVGLDANLVDLCVAEANWAIETGKYPQGTAIPNFKEIIYPGILKE